MKTKAIILIAVSTIVTLSFTFISGSKHAKKQTVTTSQKVSDEPVGGFVSEDKL
ncbi:MAG: hypothetical protein ACOYXT_28185 [Bacteroidota bacterium]